MNACFVLLHRFISVLSVDDDELLTGSSQMAQFMPSYNNLLSAAMSDCHYIQCSPVASCAVQFPTPVSQQNLPALIASISHSPQWQHAAVLPAASSSPSSSSSSSSAAAAAASVSGQVQWPHAGHTVAWQGNDLSQPSNQALNTDLLYVTVLFSCHSFLTAVVAICLFVIVPSALRERVTVCISQ